MDELAAARKRIEQLYDPQVLRAAGHRLADLLADHLRQVESSQGWVLNWNPPPENIAAAASFLRRGDDEPARSPEAIAERFVTLSQTMLDRGHNLHDPRYIGHQVPASLPLAGLFDAAGSITNQVMAIYEMGPWATAVERALIEELGVCLGFPSGQFAGLVTHGGSLANLTGLLTARNVALPGVWEHGGESSGSPPVLVVQADAHYSIARAAGILGLGSRQVIRAELDDRRKMDPHHLEKLLTRLKREGHSIVAVVGCACATPIGAFDSLEEIAAVCRRHGVWLHVDAAHGGAACLSDRYRPLVRGLELADSVVLDAHKMLFVPALCAFVFYRNRAHRFEAFQQDAPYLFDPSAPGLAEYDSGLLTIECTKRAAAFGLWGMWSLVGRQPFADLVDITFGLGRRFYELLHEAADFEPLHEPECNIVAFRHIPPELRDAPPERIGRFQQELRRRVIESGQFYLVQTQLNGVAALRITIMNPLTTEQHLQDLMHCLREMGREMLRGERGTSAPC